MTRYIVNANREDQNRKVFGTHEFLDSQLTGLATSLTKQGDQLVKDRQSRSPGEQALLALHYELVKAEYQKVFSQREEMQRLIAVENAHLGDRMTVMDPAGPAEFVGPNRSAITALGGFSGLAFGGLAVAGLYRKKQRRLLA